MLNPKMAFVGERLAGDPDHELKHFCRCPRCGQPLDKRDLAAVFHHEEPGHAPLPVADAVRLAMIDRALEAALVEHPAPRAT